MCEPGKLRVMMAANFKRAIPYKPSWAHGDAMNDREFLMWLHARLTDVHGESSLIDYMHKFRAVIYSIPENHVTPNDGRGGNDLASLRENCAEQRLHLTAIAAGGLGLLAGFIIGLLVGSH